ncbi:MAG: hypothetical protein Q4A28_04090 [Brachymonas sp.]|nr:hypothetical protein [Brachymonas sp.]
MLRWTLALIVLANLLFFAWSQHWLAPLGLAPMSEGEPYRLQEQLHPEAIVLRPARSEAASRLAPAPTGETAADAEPGADAAGAATAPAAESVTGPAPTLAQ